MNGIAISYVTKTRGLSGKVKENPEDFIVEEITPDGTVLEIDRDIEIRGEEGEYTTFTLQKVNWDTLRAIKRIARAVGVSKKRLKFAGTKDRRAVTIQRVSAWRVEKEKLANLRLKDMKLMSFSSSKEPVNLGNLLGNRFTIRIKDLDVDGGKAKEIIEHILEGMKYKMPNYYGEQRFGTRGDTHMIGKLLLETRYEEAVKAYLTAPGDLDDGIKEAREQLASDWDYRKALSYFPKQLNYEKAIMNHLVNNNNDYIGALRKLPKKLRWMFVHAYQAYIFNKDLGARIKAKKVPNELPLVGYNSKLDKTTEKILKAEGINKEMFNVKEMTELSSEGITRATFVEIEDFEVLDVGDRELTLRFRLPKGAYATTLLNEIMKS